uniref:Uncharacterized protein n=1 Tax=Oryza meridionalis TaxID=40149 RepID=A0A0E0EU96_9ORYZ
MGDANENPAQQGDANKSLACQGLPPRHLIIPYAIAAAMANRPIRLASQARLLGGGGGAVAQQPPAQHAIPAQRRLPSRNPWSRIVPSLLPDGESYRIIDTSFTSEESQVPTPPPPLLVSTARRPAETSVTPIATAFAWPVPPRGWTVSPTTGRYRFGYGYGGASSSSTAPAAPTTTQGPTPLLLLPVPPVPAPLVPAPPAPAPHLVVPRGGWTVSPTTGSDHFGDDGASSSTAAPLMPVAHSAPPETTPYVPALPVPTPSTVAPVGLTVSPTTARYSFGYGGASSSSATPRAPTASLAQRAPPHLRAPRRLAPPVPTPPAPATHVPMPPAPAPPVPTPPAPAPPADVSPRFTLSPTTIRHSFGYDGASSSSTMPRVRFTSLALRAPAPHLRAPLCTLAPPAPTPPAPTSPVPTPPAPAAPAPLADVPPGFTMSLTTTCHSFGYDGASSSFATPHMRTISLALRAPAPHLRVPHTLAPPAPTPPAPATPIPMPPTPTPPVPTAPAPAPPADVPPEFTVSLTTIRPSFGYDGASSLSATPRMHTTSLALRALAPHLRVSRAPAPTVPTPLVPAPPVPTPHAPAPPADVPPGFIVSPTTARYSFDYGGVSSSSTPRVPTTSLALRSPAPHLRVLRVPAPPVPTPPAPAPPVSMLPSPAPSVHTPPVTAPPATAPPVIAPPVAAPPGSASSPSTVPRMPSAPLALRALAPHLCALRVSVPHPRASFAPAPPVAAPRGWTMSPTTARYSFGDNGVSSSSAAPRASTAPLALHAPAPHLRAPPVAAPPPAAPRGWTMPPTTGRYSFSYGGVSLSYATPRAPMAPLALHSPAPHLRVRRAPTAPPAAAAATPRAPTPPTAAPAAPPASSSGLPSWPVLVRPPTGPARARLAPTAPAEAFEEYLVQRRAIEATVDDTPWEMIGSSTRTGGPMFAVAGGGHDRAELEAKEAREHHKNMMDKRKATAAACVPQPQPPPPPSLPADAPGSSGGGSKNRGGGRKKKQA